jgi:hypothetical protein
MHPYAGRARLIFAVKRAERLTHGETSSIDAHPERAAGAVPHFALGTSRRV